ncbi:MAG: metallophosphoesterase [Oscillospiraceae bacterium]|nr:metallophosphoesterase [Oscillospiraceae bacterium]
MRILVISDSHGDWQCAYRAIASHKSAEVVIHLGDGASDMRGAAQDFPEKAFYQVSGNNDFTSSAANFELLKLAGKVIFCTHGHLFHVKYGLERVEYAARERGADICLFGHTHRAFLDYSEGLYLLNPGMCHGRDASCGIIDITEAGIVTNIVEGTKWKNSLNF